MVPFVVALLVAAAGPAAAAGSCNTVAGYVIGDRAGTYAHAEAAGQWACCSRCQREADSAGCILFTYEGTSATGTCFLKNTSAGTARSARPGAISGCVTPAACGAQPVDWPVD